MAMLPVSPQPLHSHSLSPLGAGSAEAAGVHSEEEEEVDMKKALLADPIVGTKSVVMDQHGPGAISAKPLASPPSMTPKERAIHNLTHLPYHPGCAICAATRRANSMHLRSHEHTRVVPMMAGDYCFMRFVDEKCTQPVLVLRLYPYKLFFAMVVPRKGIDLFVIRQIVNFIRDAGVTHFVYRADKEPAIGAMIDEAVSMLGRFARAALSDEDRTDHGLPIAVDEDDEPDAPPDAPSPITPAAEGSAPDAQDGVLSPPASSSTSSS